MFSTCIPVASYAEVSDSSDVPSADEVDSSAGADATAQPDTSNDDVQDEAEPEEENASASNKSKKKSSKSSSSKKTKDVSSEKKSSEDDKDSKSEEKKTEDATKASKKVDAKLDSSSSSLSKMNSAADKVSGALSDLESAEKKKSSAEKASSSISKKIEATEALIARAQTVLASVEDELSHVTEVGMAEVLRGEASFDDIDSREYLLNKVAQDRRETIEDLEKQKTDLEKKLTKKNELVEKAQTSFESAVASGNDAAYSVEKHASKMRASDKKASDIASRASGSGASALKSDTNSTVKSHNSSRLKALEKAAQWYEEVDTKDGDVALSFGEGADFELSEDEFVEKWGKAIDAFYSDYGSSAGYSAPLGGHGQTMARVAYKYRIDPRLCAAVSIIESGGGKYCIKSCNAWGWGAADSDPYGGASAWGSWDSAIEAWHKGMANSKTGLAAAPTVGQLGEIYCSSKIWANNIVSQMEKISALA